MNIEQTLNQVNAANGDLGKAAEILGSVRTNYGAGFFYSIIDWAVAKREDDKVVSALLAADACKHVSDSDLLAMVKSTVQLVIGFRMAAALDGVIKFALNNAKFTDEQYKEVLDMSRGAYNG